MFSGLDDGFAAVCRMAIGFIFLVIFCICVSVYYFCFKKDTVKSRTKIDPTIELVIENNKVDTIYVYKER